MVFPTTIFKEFLLIYLLWMSILSLPSLNLSLSGINQAHWNIIELIDKCEKSSKHGAEGGI
jgi:hypothetical protein